jgi:outer membrane receptor protein involved in Fe transport
MTIRLRTTIVGIAATAFLASGAAAQSAPADKAEAAPPSVPFSQDKAATDEVLEKATAREDVSQTAQSQQNSTVTGNSVNGTSTTGTISFSDNAFQTASGLTVINANSGNNVSMNASMNVNIVMVPATPQP